MWSRIKSEGEPSGFPLQPPPSEHTGIVIHSVKFSLMAVRAAAHGGPRHAQHLSHIFLFSPNEQFIRTGRTRRRGTGFTSRPRAAGTLRRTVRSSFPHRATARWGPQCGPPIEFRFRPPKRLRLRRVFPLWAAVGGGPYGDYLSCFVSGCRGRLSWRPVEPSNFVTAHSYAFVGVALPGDPSTVD